MPLLTILQEPKPINGSYEGIFIFIRQLLPEIHYLSISYKVMIKFPFLFVLQGMPSIFLQTVIIQHSELLFSSTLKYFKLPY